MSERSAREWTRLLVETWERDRCELLGAAVVLEVADEEGELELLLAKEASPQVELTVQLLLDRYLPVHREYVTGGGGLLLLSGLIALDVLEQTYEAAGILLSTGAVSLDAAK